MDGSDHSRISSSGSGTDENDQSYQHMGMNLRNSKKPMTKHFMSPTISASSKAIAPRKKILAERNQISDPIIQKNPNIDNSDVELSLSGASLSPYDPLPNYPSPRPKFLRYKPNRCSEIVSRYENEAQESISLPSKEDEEVDLVCVSQEVEEEEEEEESEGVLRRVLKLVLVLVILVSSTMYISSMNSPEVPSHTLQAIEGFRDGYLKIHDQVYGAMRRLGGEDHFLKRIGFKEILKKFEIGNEFLEGNMSFMKVNQTVITGECIEEEVVEDSYQGKVETTIDNLSEVGDNEIEDEKKIRDGDLSDTIEVEAGAIEDVFDQMAENFELKEETESIDKVESLQDTQIPTMSNAFEQENKYVMELVPEVNDVGDGDLEMVRGKMTKIVKMLLTRLVRCSCQRVWTTDLQALRFSIWKLRAILIKKGFVEQIESDLLFKAVIGVAMALAIISPLVLAFQLKRKRNATKKCNQSGVAEKCNSVLPNEREEHIKRVDSFVSPPISLINSTVEDSIDLNQSQAPAVELLNEFVVGEISSSFRSRAMKSKMEESEVSSKAYSLVPNHSPLDFSELSALNISSSYEEFTPQKKKMKKEDGKDGEAKKVSATLVRRSSRIRNRSVTSP